MPAVKTGGSPEKESNTLTWKCMYCGAENDETEQYCDGCGDKRTGKALDPKFRVVGKTEATYEAKDEAKDLDDEIDDEDKDFEKGFEASIQKSLKPPTFEDETEDLSKESIEPSDEPDFEDKVTPPVQPVPVPESTSQEPPVPEPEPAPVVAPVVSPEPTPEPATQPSVQTERQGYYLVFVNTPASSLIKSRVSIDFDIFPQVTIGRNPENIIVIPDQEVSRKHAELTFDGSRIMLRDLNSSNGTFIYNGKEFQRVSDSVEVKPNTILKFGTNTVVRIITG